MRNKYLSLLFIPIASLIISGCNNSADQDAFSFEKSEYQIHSGEKVTVKQNLKNVQYYFVGEVPVNTTLNQFDGTITFTSETPNYSQVLLGASHEEKEASPVVVTLLQNNVTTELNFITPIKNITDGDYILVTSSNNTAIKYTLENDVLGVSIDSMSGRVSYTSAAVEGSAFVVVVSSADKIAKETYYVAKEHLVNSLTPSQAIEVNSNADVAYVLDFSDVPAGTEENVIGIYMDKKAAGASDYIYDTNTHTLVVKAAYLKTLPIGENNIKIITSRNIITVKAVVATKFIRNAVDLQSINANREALAGYYILENDIDLTDYLAFGGQGYNDARGWNQIGIYHDLENDPERDSFTGTFDGNGYTISGYFEERADDLAHNEGLFGYVTKQGVVKNTGFKSALKEDGKKRVTQGRNFIGGFVGFNEGTIKNCWVDVDISNKHEEKIFHSVGAFVGGNTGIIDSCYTLGTPSGDNLVGAFVGKQYGEITNCYSLNETNNPFFGIQVEGSCENIQMFSTLGDMKQFDFSAHFDNEAWEFQNGSLPTLKHSTDIKYANGVEIMNKQKDLYRGESFDINVNVYPTSKQDQYIDNVTYSLLPENSGVTLNGTHVDTVNAIINDFTIVANIESEAGAYSDAKSFHIYDNINSIEIVDDLPAFVEPGKQYAINVNVDPVGADPELTWEITNEGRGKAARFAFFTGNILTIKEDIMNYDTKNENPVFTIVGTSKNGLTVSKELTLKRIHYLGSTYTASGMDENITEAVQVLYQDSNAEFIEFTLPNSADIASMSVYRFSAQIYDYQRSGHTIRIPKKYISEMPNTQMTFTFRCGSGNSLVIYRGYGCYIDHARYTLETIAERSYITLGSAQDFYDNFRLVLTDTHEEKYLNYNKTFVLTNDIDFENAIDLVGIGYESSSRPTAKPFSGKIYGFGHVIKNATFHYSERYYFEGPNDSRHDPNTYNIGFFGYFSGSIYDVVFMNINSVAYNYGGCFAGRIIAGGYLENVTFIGCKTESANEVDYTIDDVVQGRIAAFSAGTFVGVTYNGTAVGLIGK